MRDEHAAEMARREQIAKVAIGHEQAWKIAKEEFANRRPVALDEAVKAFIKVVKDSGVKAGQPVPMSWFEEAVERVWLMGMATGGQLAAELATSSLVFETAKAIASAPIAETVQASEVTQRLIFAGQLQARLRSAVLEVLDPPPIPRGFGRPIGNTIAEAN